MGLFGAKSTVETLLIRSQLPSLIRRVRPSDLILAYHNVVPEGESAAGDRSLHLPVADLRSQLDRLTRTHDVVPLASLLDPGVERNRPRVAITFDDAYRGAITCGVDEL